MFLSRANYNFTIKGESTQSTVKIFTNVSNVSRLEANQTLKKLFLRYLREESAKPDRNCYKIAFREIYSSAYTKGLAYRKFYK